MKCFLARKGKVRKNIHEIKRNEAEFFSYENRIED